MRWLPLVLLALLTSCDDEPATCARDLACMDDCLGPSVSSWSDATVLSCADSCGPMTRATDLYVPPAICFDPAVPTSAAGCAAHLEHTAWQQAIEDKHSFAYANASSALDLRRVCGLSSQ